MDLIERAYNVVFYERADHRVKEWFLMKSPLPLAVIIFTYLALIKLILPVYMRNRKPYDLRGIIKWYNIVQMIGCAIATWGTEALMEYLKAAAITATNIQELNLIVTSGWTTTYHFGCLLPDYSDDPMALRMLSFMWFTVILKLLELLETVFFILRKKERQASFLHIYHHVTTLIIIWCGTKYIGGGMASLPPLINNAVHVIMYGYYLLTSEGGPKLRAVLNRYKKWLTVIQIIQFNIMLLHGSQILLPSCKMGVGFAPLYFPSVIFVYYMFYEFFKDNYLNKKTKQGLNSAQNGKSIKGNL